MFTIPIAIGMHSVAYVCELLAVVEKKPAIE